MLRAERLICPNSCTIVTGTSGKHGSPSRACCYRYDWNCSCQQSCITRTLLLAVCLCRSLPEFLWPWSINCVWPVRGSQNWTPLSLEPDTIQLPSGVVATDKTKSLWPLNTWMHGFLPLSLPYAFVPSCHILNVLSKLPLISVFPSGINATE